MLKKVCTNMHLNKLLINYPSISQSFSLQCNYCHLSSAVEALLLLFSPIPPYSIIIITNHNKKHLLDRQPENEVEKKPD